MWVHVEGHADEATPGVDPLPPAHKSPLWLSLYKNTIPASLIWSRGCQSPDWGIYSKAAQLTQERAFSLRIDSSVDIMGLRSWNCPIFVELGSKQKSWDFEALGGFPNWQVYLLPSLPTPTPMENMLEQVEGNLTSPFSGGSPLPKVLVTTRTRVSCSRCTMSYSSMDIT